MTNRNVLRLAGVRRAVRTGAARSIRVRSGLSQSDVARTIGVTPSAVSRWESGERLPQGEAALRYGRLLEELAAQEALAG